MKIKKIRISLFLPFLFILIGLFIGFSLFNKNNELPNQWKITDNSNINNPKFISQESLVNEIKSVNKIVPLELELSDEVIINDSWGDIKIFEKIKRITFYANCSYYIDLSNLSNDSINTLDDKIQIFIPKPKILSINILSEKTTYTEPELGLLRFGDIKLSSEEYGVIYNDVLKIFSEKMLSQELYDKAMSESEIAIKKLITDITGSNKEIEINFK